MYREDTSTSSEDEASTAETATTATTTADMCRTEVRNGAKVLRCTGCGYTSDRRANVTRHYVRIHGLLKRGKYRECPCGDRFYSKWEFYNHCHDYHPNLRQSLYTTTRVYKLEQTKAKLKQQSANSRPSAPRSDKSDRGPARKGLATRASTRRLRKQPVRSTSHSESSTSSFSGRSETSSTGPSTSSFSRSSTSFGRESSLRTSESEDIDDENAEATFPAYRSESTSESEDTGVKKTASNFVVFRTSESEDASDENSGASFAHLPIKKRYTQTVRRVLGDITNQINVEVQKVHSYSSDSNNNTPVSTRDLYLSKMDARQRAFLGHIDFDELDAILKLRDMKKGM